MIKKITITLAALILALFPFFVGNTIGKYSPYAEGNSFQTYVIIWTVVSVTLISLVAVLVKYSLLSFEKVSNGGALLFLLVCPLIGIMGLVEAPDLSLKMLDHPEREHLRYTMLFIAAILFAVFDFILLKRNPLELRTSTRWILTAAVSLAMTEFLYEFTHHYFYPEALKEWIDNGNSVDTFNRSYDDTTMINIGVAGRLIQFSLIVCLSVLLYKARQVRIWSPIVSIIFSLCGIATATLVYFIHFDFPKGYEFLMLFFIPGIPFILLYWLGVAMVTKLKQR